MSIITRAEIIASAPARWARQYEHTTNERHSFITDRLAALKPGFSAEIVNAIIGNTSWTECRCDVCRKDVPAVVLLAPEWSDSGVSVCAECLALSAAQLPTPQQADEALPGEV